MKLAGRLQRFAGAVDRQHASVVGQRVQHDGGVLARLDHFVEIADA